MASVPMKEALVVVLDVSMTVGTDGLRRGRALCENLFEQKIIFAPRDEVTIILSGSTKTRNRLNLATPSRFGGIFVVSPIEVPTLEVFKPLSELCETEQGSFDMLESIIVACDLIFEKTEKKRYTRRIFLVTNAAATVKRKEELDSVITSLKNQGVALIVIGIDFDPMPHPASEDWAELSMKQQNERVLAYMCQQLGDTSMVVPVTDALEALSALRKRSVGQRSMARCVLSIGDVRIPVQLFNKTQIAVVPSLKKVTSKGDGVVTERRFFSASTPGLELQSSDRVKAFHYGRSVIPVSEVDEASLKFTGERSLQVLGFIPLQQVPMFLLLGGVKAVAAAPDDPSGAQALAAFAAAMDELQRGMLVRFVLRTNSDPVLGVCIPSVKSTRSILYFATLPFAEDLRHYNFRSLNDVQVSAEQQSAVAQLVTTMTVPDTTLRPKEVFSPALQQHYACVRHRFLHPGEPLPPIPPQLAASSCCWGDSGNILAPVMTGAEAALRRTAALFPFEPKTAKAGAGSKVFWFAAGGGGNSNDSSAAASDGKAESGRQAAQQVLVSNPASSATPSASQPSPSLRVAIDIANRPVVAVTTVDPVGTFHTLLTSKSSVDVVERALFQMTEVTLALLKSSIGPQLYKRCDECIDALRAVAAREGEPRTFNQFLTNVHLTAKAEAHELFWVKHVLERGVLPITKLECPESDLANEQAAREFLAQDRQAPAPVVEPMEEEDLFGQLE